MSTKRDYLDEQLQEQLDNAYGGDLDEFRTDVQDFLAAATTHEEDHRA